MSLRQFGEVRRTDPPRASACRRLENRAGFARIGIEPEDQEFGRERAEIDRAVDQRLRIVPFPRAVRRRLAVDPPAACGPGCRGTKDRSTFSSTSLASGSSVTTQFWPTVAETRPVTCRPSAPRRVTRNWPQARQIAQPRDLRHRRARAGVGHQIEMPAGLGDVLDRDRNAARRRPVSAGIGRTCSDDLCLPMCNGLRIGKDNLAAQQGVVFLGFELPQRGARIARQPRRRRRPPFPRLERYCAPAPSQAPDHPPRRRRRDRRPAGRKRLRRSAACASAPRGRRRPSPADCRRDRGRTRRTIFCPIPRRHPSLPPSRGQHQHEMKHDQVEPALDRVRHPVACVKHRRARLRHDGAIERRGCCDLAERGRKRHKIIRLIRVAAGPPARRAADRCRWIANR